MLQIENLTIRQGDFSLRANWSLAKGQKLAIIGPSGGGKSTLLSTIAGFVEPEKGQIRIDGQDLADMLPGARPVSLLFQENNLFPHLSVAQNVGLGRSPQLKLSKVDHLDIAQVLDRVGLPEMLHRRPADLSGGQRQRVALARALLRDRPLLMLDEPFAALGPALKKDMLGLVNDVTAETGATLIMVTHDPADAQQISDVTSLVSNGVSLPPEGTAGFFTNPTDELAAYLGKD